MIRTIHDFTERWAEEAVNTLKVFGNLTDTSLRTAIPGGRTLGTLANHLIETMSEFPNKLGLPIAEDDTIFTSVEELIEAYRKASDLLLNAVTENWNDDILEEERNMYGMTWKNGLSLWYLLVHQSHHRAQMTVLMRFAGLKVPGVYGPSKEEWMAYQAEPAQ